MYKRGRKEERKRERERIYLEIYRRKRLEEERLLLNDTSIIHPF